MATVLRHPRWTRVLASAAAMLVAASLGGCGLQIPADPDGTLDRVTGGILRVGASPEEGLVLVDGPDVTGTLAELVEGFAETRDAEIQWTVASEETLVTALEDGELDLAIGGMTDASPWVDRVGVTRGYPGIADGRSVVILLPMGENALQAALEAHLDAEVGS